ncbi:hypothetical protein H4R35_002358 [Dimargaris xerosporica]|nr:hypothetical protein H4R35_002358 [Dimargaris xerosporica]
MLGRAVLSATRASQSVWAGRAGGRLQSTLQLTTATRWSLTKSASLRTLSTTTLRLTNTTASSTKESTPSEARPAPSEKVVGTAQSHEFKAETRQLLDIVAHSLYSEREVFVRELVSNASDALEKLRHLQLTDSSLAADHPLEISIYTDADNNTLTIQDSGIGMSEEELVGNLGTIAHSGSKDFMKQLEKSGKGGSNAASARERIIGQFGVGFYSAFMVGDKLTVYTRSAKPGAKGYCWVSDGLGSYTISEAEGVAVGTKIVISLRDNSKEFVKPDRIKEIVQKYSNFVGFQVKLNNEPINTVTALWKRDKNSITEEEFKKFYQFLTSEYQNYRYHLVYKTDAPLSIHSVLYIPETNEEAVGFGQSKAGVNLYSRTVLIQAHSDKILPHWLRFIKGVVDSEDIPLNLSRELLQDGLLIRRLRETLTRRIIKWLESESKADPEKFATFLKQFSYYLKEGALQDQNNSEKIANLLRFSTTALEDGQMTSFGEYIDRMVKGQDAIFYMQASNRKTAEDNAYLEAFKRRNVEVMLLFDNFDPIVFSQLNKIRNHALVSIDSAEAEKKLKSIPLARDAAAGKDQSAASAADTTSKGAAEGGATTSQLPALTKDDLQNLHTWLLATLGNRVKDIKVSERLVSHPAVVLGHQDRATRQLLKAMQERSGGSGSGFPMMPEVVSLEINPTHPVIVGLYHLKDANSQLAKAVAEQVLDNALLSAGALNDPLDMVPRLNQILQSTVQAAAASPASSSDSSAQLEKPDIPVVEGEKV